MAREGWTVVCGGLGGVMEAIARGAQESGGEVIRILPGPDPEREPPGFQRWLPPVSARKEPSGRHERRRRRGSGGKNGTLSEIGHALALGRESLRLADLGASGS